MVWSSGRLAGRGEVAHQLVHHVVIARLLEIGHDDFAGHRPRQRRPILPSRPAAHRPSILFLRARDLELQFLVVLELVFEGFLAFVERGHSAAPVGLVAPGYSAPPAALSTPRWWCQSRGPAEETPRCRWKSCAIGSARRRPSEDFVAPSRCARSPPPSTRRIPIPERRSAAAALALALFPRCRAAVQDRTGRPCRARRFPAAGAAAAAHVGGQPLRFRRRAAQGRRDDPARLADQVGGTQDRLDRLDGVRHRAAHRVGSRAAPRFVEEQDIVYREAAKPGEKQREPKPAPTDATWSKKIVADSGAAVPLLRAHLQRPSHPLRPALCHRHRRLSGPDRARPADGHAADGAGAPFQSRQGSDAASSSARWRRSMPAPPSRCRRAAKPTARSRPGSPTARAVLPSRARRTFR